MSRTIAILTLLLCAATFSCAGDSDVEPVVDETGEDTAVAETEEKSDEVAPTEMEEAETTETETTEIATESESLKSGNVGAFCPECGSGNVAPIIYGKPAQELVDKAERGEVKLGGCVVSRESPYNYCRDCETEW